MECRIVGLKSSFFTVDLLDEGNAFILKHLIHRESVTWMWSIVRAFPSKYIFELISSSLYLKSMKKEPKGRCVGGEQRAGLMKQQLHYSIMAHKSHNKQSLIALESMVPIKNVANNHRRYLQVDLFDYSQGAGSRTWLDSDLSRLLGRFSQSEPWLLQKPTFYEYRRVVYGNMQLALALLEEQIFPTSQDTRIPNPSILRTDSTVFVKCPFLPNSFQKYCMECDALQPVINISSQELECPYLY